jgi:hypothetical protein
MSGAARLPTDASMPFWAGGVGAIAGVLAARSALDSTPGSAQGRDRSAFVLVTRAIRESIAAGSVESRPQAPVDATSAGVSSTRRHVSPQVVPGQ